jgi:hypothetical protein
MAIILKQEQVWHYSTRFDLQDIPLALMVNVVSAGQDDKVVGDKAMFWSSYILSHDHDDNVTRLALTSVRYRFNASQQFTIVHIYF